MKKIITTIVLVLSGATGWLFVEPLLSEEPASVVDQVTQDESPAKPNTEPEQEGVPVIPDTKEIPEEEVMEKNEGSTTLDTKPTETVIASVTTVQEKPAAVTPPTPPATPKTFSGNFVDADPSHLASGAVTVANKQITFASSFDSTWVPDGYVELSNDLDSNDSVRIARLKNNNGSQSYSIPANVDPADYKYVLIWCRAFRVLVGSARINP